MAKYQKYAEYKDSDIVWMGDVPVHWTSERFKWLLTEKAKTTNFELPAGSISFGEVVYKNEENLSSETKASYQEVLKDEFLINPLNLNYDLKSLRTALSKINVVVSTGYIVLHCNKSLDKKYVRWLLHEFDVAHMKTLGAGVRQTVNFSDIANCYFYLPNYFEQTQIANFLNYETAKIDTLIAKQEKLIELLKEKRQAVISHAVTKGLNPNVPMKDSGVEWLGEVPEHWGISSIGYYAKVSNGTTPSKANLSYWDKEEISWLSSGEVNQYYIDEASEYITKKALQECSLELLPIGTVVMGMIGQGKTRGLSAITKIEATINQNLAALETYSRLNNEYLHYYLQAAYDYIREEGRGGNQAALNCEIIRKFPITIPPFEEQIKLVEQIKSLSVTYKALIYKAESAIQLMQERRIALISAAVTGKIDVRNWQHPNQNNNNNTELSA